MGRLKQPIFRQLGTSSLQSPSLTRHRNALSAERRLKVSIEAHSDKSKYNPSRRCAVVQEGFCLALDDTSGEILSRSHELDDLQIASRFSTVFFLGSISFTISERF